MRILHYKKTKGTKTEVSVNTTVALDPKNFATYTKEQDGVLRHVGVAWSLPVDADSEDYKGHRFELLMEPAELDQVLAAVTLAKERFLVATVPGNVDAAQEEVKADAEG